MHFLLGTQVCLNDNWNRFVWKLRLRIKEISVRTIQIFKEKRAEKSGQIARHFKLFLRYTGKLYN